MRLLVSRPPHTPPLNSPPAHTRTPSGAGIYDAFKVYVGLPTTGAAPPPEPVTK